MSNPDWNPYPNRWWLADYESEGRVVTGSLDWSVMATDSSKNWHCYFPRIHHDAVCKKPIELPMEYCL